jgi:hypothetical protein
MALAVALAGCQAKLPTTLPNTQVGNTQNGKVEAPPMRLAGLQFTAVSPETAAQLAQKGGMGSNAESATRASGAAAPMAPPAPGMAADSAVGAKMVASPYYFGSYFSGPYGQMKLNSVTEAKAAGSAGTWKAMQADVIAPVIAEWAADARLIQTNGSLGADGKPVQGSENYPGENAWRASYASASRGEVLEFTINAGETHVVRMQWVPIVIDSNSMAVDASDAVAKLTRVVADAAFMGKEDELGRDYVFGDQNGGVGIGIAVPAMARASVNTAVAVDAPPPPTSTPGSSGSASTSIAVGEPAPDVYMPPKEEPVYKLASGGRWYVNLQTIGDHLVWDLSYNPPPDTTVRNYNPGETFTDNYAYGMVDAKTGDVIRLRRPMKITLPVGPTPATKPEPRPIDTKVDPAQ